MRLGGRRSGGVKGAAVVGRVAVQLDSRAPAGNGKRLDLHGADADQDRKVSSMAPSAATVIGTVMIRENLERTRSLHRSEARQNKQDQQDPAHVVPASDLREPTRYAHA